MKNREGPTVVDAAKKIIAEFKRVGAPIRGLQTDGEFVSQVFLNLLASQNPPIKNWKSLPYNPSSNGSVERSNAVLARAISTRERQFDKKNWSQVLSTNTTKGAERFVIALF